MLSVENTTTFAGLKFRQYDFPEEDYICKLNIGFLLKTKKDDSYY